MQAFKEYLRSEYQVNDATSIMFAFTHSSTVKTDRKSGSAILVHTIGVTIKFYDKDMNMLHKASIKFVNNKLPKKTRESLVNIAPDELENRFVAAKRDIANEIYEDYNTKRQMLDIKIEALMHYENINATPNVNVIPNQFEAEMIQLAPTNDSSKQHFDM